MERHGRSEDIHWMYALKSIKRAIFSLIFDICIEVHRSSSNLSCKQSTFRSSNTTYRTSIFHLPSTIHEKMSSTTKTFHHAPYPSISAVNPQNTQAGKTVLITGSASGIGYATAHKFAQANASRIIISGRDSETLKKAAARLEKEEEEEEEEAKSKPSEILTRVLDINEESSIDELWKSFADEGIVIDILILNAADTSGGPVNPLLDAWPQFRAMFNTNVFGNVLMAARFLDSPNCVKGEKTPINLTSCLAHSNPARLQAAYSASKVASSSFFQHLAQEIPVEQCRIINLHPGLIPNTSSTGKAPPELIEMVRWDQGTWTAISPTMGSLFPDYLPIYYPQRKGLLIGLQQSISLPQFVFGRLLPLHRSCMVDSFGPIGTSRNLRSARLSSRSRGI